jgi:hypothetical protein
MCGISSNPGGREVIIKANEMNRQAFPALISGRSVNRQSTTALPPESARMVDVTKGGTGFPAPFRRGAYIQPVTYEEVLETQG